MTLSGKKVLVTGAGGFIGSHLCEALVRAGARVRALVHYNALGDAGWLSRDVDQEMREQIELVAGDICDAESVEHAVQGRELVFHLAALIAIPYSYTSPRSYVRTNVEGTLNVLQAVRRHGCERLVHTSTSEVYGTAQVVPISEEHPLQGQSPYSATKIGADMLVESFGRSFELPVTTVRPFNTFGPRQSARAVIPTIIGQCLAGRARIKLGSLSPTRDMNYVGNTVAGFIAAGRSDPALHRVLNFGTGREISIGDLARKIAELVGVPDIEIVSDEQRIRPKDSEVERLCADSSLATQLTGWEPETSLETGLQRTIEWIRANQAMYQSDGYVI